MSLSTNLKDILDAVQTSRITKTPQIWNPDSRRSSWTTGSSAQEETTTTSSSSHLTHYLSKTNISTSIHRQIITGHVPGGNGGFWGANITECSAAVVCSQICQRRAVLFQLAQEKPGQILGFFVFFHCPPDCLNSCCIMFLGSFSSPWSFCRIQTKPGQRDMLCQLTK